MEKVCACLQSLAILTMMYYFCQGSVIFGESKDRTTENRKIRQKRHVVLDNNKLCKAVGCVNGYCKESELRNYRIVCECFTGYEGTLCDKLKCPYDCGQHGTCARKGSAVYCKCDQGFYGAKCESYSQTHPSISTDPQYASTSLLRVIGSVISVYDAQNPAMNMKDTWYSQTASPKHMKFSEFHSHAEIDTSVEPDICAPGFQCYHGNCDREAMSYGLFQCLCKFNYTGLFCEKRCTLDCKNGGTCMVLDDGHQLCSCPFDFTGHYCEKAA